MQISAEFPTEMLSFLRCSHDGGPLHASDIVRGERSGISQARLECKLCEGEFHILDGIARFSNSKKMDSENIHEMTTRNAEYDAATEFSPCSLSTLSDLVELPPFLRAIQADERSIIMEIGCGDGRFTLLMCQRGARVVAIDLSLSALKKLNSRLATGRAPTPFPQDEHRIKDYRSKVALIHADASTIRIAPKSINRALATTPLDSRNERLSLYATVSDALTDDGWYIGSVEYDDFFRRSSRVTFS